MCCVKPKVLGVDLARFCCMDIPTHQTLIYPFLSHTDGFVKIVNLFSVCLTVCGRPPLSFFCSSYPILYHSPISSILCDSLTNILDRPIRDQLTSPLSLISACLLLNLHCLMAPCSTCLLLSALALLACFRFCHMFNYSPLFTLLHF